MKQMQAMMIKQNTPGGDDQYIKEDTDSIEVKKQQNLEVLLKKEPNILLCDEVY